MTALERQGRVAYWGQRDFVLADGEQAIRGYAACYEFATRKVVAAKSAPGLLLIGVFVESLLGNGISKVPIEMPTELRSRWFINDDVAPCLVTDRFLSCFIKDGQTVSIDGTNRSTAGRILDVGGGSVLVQIASEPDDDVSGSGITAAEHAALRQLIHLADGGGPFEQFASGAYREIVGGIFPTAITWYTDASKAAKIVDKQLTYNATKTPATVQWRAFALDGSTVLATVTDTISYAGIFETNRTRVIA